MPIISLGSLKTSEIESFNYLVRIRLNDVLSQASLPEGYTIREAQEQDITDVMSLLAPSVQRRQIMRRTRAETAALIPTGFSIIHRQQLVGFASVEIYSKKLSEIQCLAVSDDHRGLGLGRELVRCCIALAESRGVMEVMAISSSEKFLQDLGFDYSLPNQKRALFYQLRSREEVYRELESQESELGE